MFAVVVSQLFRHTSMVTTEPGQGWLTREGSYKLSVSPGDAEIELILHHVRSVAQGTFEQSDGRVDVAELALQHTEA